MILISALHETYIQTQERASSSLRHPFMLCLTGDVNADAGGASTSGRQQQGGVGVAVA